MKKMKVIALVLAVVLCLGVFGACASDDLKAANEKIAELEKKIADSKVYPQDPFTSASEPQEKYQLGVTLDEVSKLMTKGFPGTYLIVTVNPDGSPNVGYVIFGVKKVGDKYYVQQGVNNQSNTNLLREKGGICVWVDQYDSEAGLGKGYTTRGIKMYVELTEDDAPYKALELDKTKTNLYEVKSTLQLG